MDHVIKAMTHDIGGIGYINKQKDFSLHFLLLRLKIPELNNLLNFIRIPVFNFDILPVFSGIVSGLFRICR